MEKEIHERIEKLEKELQTSKGEIKKIKSSFTYFIESNIRRLISGLSKQQLVVGFFSLAILVAFIGIAGTVTKNHTFSDGELVSAAKFNANFDTIYTLVNGNLDDNNISGISTSKITSGTLSSDRLGSISDSTINGGNIVMYYTNETYTAQDIGGRSGADTKCSNHKKHFLRTRNLSNIRALISVSSTDEIRDMVSNYSFPSSSFINSPFGHIVADNMSDFLAGNLDKHLSRGFIGKPVITFWTGSSQDGSLYGTHNCAGWTGSSGYGTYGTSASGNPIYDNSNQCNSGAKYLFCLAW